MKTEQCEHGPHAMHSDTSYLTMQNGAYPAAFGAFLAPGLVSLPLLLFEPLRSIARRGRGYHAVISCSCEQQQQQWDQ
jgi:hypothetical protein